jgi:hypothetical protein
MKYYIHTRQAEAGAESKSENAFAKIGKIPLPQVSKIEIWRVPEKYPTNVASGPRRRARRNLTMYVPVEED